MGSTSNNSGGGGVPPGFRFHPTDEELLHYYLKKKISFHKFEMEVIRDIDLNKLEPWDLQERCRIGSAPQNEWYFFSHKDRKYPTGSRTNRATNAGFWKATGRDKCIRNTFQKIGMRKTLVFYRGRAPHGQKTDWIMHEYRLEDPDHTDDNSLQEDGWVVCRVFKKKNLFKIGGGANEGGGGGGSSSATINNNININSSSDHHQLFLNTTTAISSNNNNNIMQTNLQYYNLLRQQPPLPSHHYLNSVAINTRDHDHDHDHDDHHDLALHSYAHHNYYSVATPDTTALRYGQPPPAATSSEHHQDQWTMLDRIVTTTTNSTSTTGHNNNNNNDEALLLLHSNNNVSMNNNNNNNNQLSLGATTAVTNTGTAEMDFWGGYAK